MTLTPYALMIESAFAFSYLDIVKCENGILELLHYRVNPGGDFTCIIASTNDLIFMSLLEYEMTCYRYSSITLASLLCVLDQSSLQNEQQ